MVNNEKTGGLGEYLIDRAKHFRDAHINEIPETMVSGPSTRQYKITTGWFTRVSALLQTAVKLEHTMEHLTNERVKLLFISFAHHVRSDAFHSKTRGPEDIRAGDHMLNILTNDDPLLPQEERLVDAVHRRIALGLQ